VRRSEKRADVRRDVDSVASARGTAARCAVGGALREAVDVTAIESDAILALQLLPESR